KDKRLGFGIVLGVDEVGCNAGSGQGDRFGWGQDGDFFCWCLLSYRRLDTILRIDGPKCSHYAYESNAESSGDLQSSLRFCGFGSLRFFLSSGWRRWVLDRICLACGRLHHMGEVTRIEEPRKLYALAQGSFVAFEFVEDDVQLLAQ